MTVQFLKKITEPETRDRLDPAQLNADAVWLLQHNDPHELVAALLKQVRENDDRQDAIRDGYGFSCRAAEARAEAAEQERNDYLFALRSIRRAMRPLRLGREP